MKELISEYYSVIRALHLISAISWMVGLFYLPRLYVYHTRVKHGSEASNLFDHMEYKLLKIIMNPAMIATFIFGFAMIYSMGLQGYGKWLHVKLVLLVLLAGFHGFLAKTRKTFASNTNTKSEKFFRVINEVPTIIMIAIIFLAVLRPF